MRQWWYLFLHPTQMTPDLEIPKKQKKGKLDHKMFVVYIFFQFSFWEYGM